MEHSDRLDHHELDLSLFDEDFLNFDIGDGCDVAVTQDGKVGINADSAGASNEKVLPIPDTSTIPSTIPNELASSLIRREISHANFSNSIGADSFHQDSLEFHHSLNSQDISAIGDCNDSHLEGGSTGLHRKDVTLATSTTIPADVVVNQASNEIQRESSFANFSISLGPDNSGQNSLEFQGSFGSLESRAVDNPDENGSSDKRIQQTYEFRNKKNEHCSCDDDSIPSIDFEHEYLQENGTALEDAEEVIRSMEHEARPNLLEFEKNNCSAQLNFKFDDRKHRDGYVTSNLDHDICKSSSCSSIGINPTPISRAVEKNYLALKAMDKSLYVANNQVEASRTRRNPSAVVPSQHRKIPVTNVPTQPLNGIDSSLSDNDVRPMAVGPLAQRSIRYALPINSIPSVQHMTQEGQINSTIPQGWTHLSIANHMGTLDETFVADTGSTLPVSTHPSSYGYRHSSSSTQSIATQLDALRHVEFPYVSSIGDGIAGKNLPTTSNAGTESYATISTPQSGTRRGSSSPRGKSKKIQSQPARKQKQKEDLLENISMGFFSGQKVDLDMFSSDPKKYARRHKQKPKGDLLKNISMGFFSGTNVESVGAMKETNDGEEITRPSKRRIVDTQSQSNSSELQDRLRPLYSWAPVLDEKQQLSIEFGGPTLLPPIAFYAKASPKGVAFFCCVPIVHSLAVGLTDFGFGPEYEKFRFPWAPLSPMHHLIIDNCISLTMAAAMLIWPHIFGPHVQKILAFILLSEYGNWAFSYKNIVHRRELEKETKLLNTKIL